MMKVLVANRTKLECHQLCKGFQWLMQGVWFKTDVLILPLDNYDMVLGIKWLQSLDDIIRNFKELTIQFKVNSMVIELNRIHKNNISLCSIEKRSSLLHKDGHVVQLQLFNMQERVNGTFQHQAKISDEMVDDGIKELLLQMEGVFQTLLVY